MEEINSNLSEELSKVDERISDLKKAESILKDLEELHEDERFKRVILDGYLEDESKRLFGVLVEPNTLKRDVIQNIQDKLSAIRSLKQYFGVIAKNATMAPMQIEEEEIYRREITKAHAEKEQAFDEASGE